MPDRVSVAAENNAHWCDAVCRAHGIRTRFAVPYWVATSRSPEFYPDVVTLSRDSDAQRALGLVDVGPGCSVKDSFADLDLSPEGFEILFEARWIWHGARSLPHGNLATWTAVETQEELAAWAAVHGGANTFRPRLLTEPGVQFLVQRVHGDIVAGAVANRSPSVVGLSNVFTAGRDVGDVWAELATIIGRRFPSVPVVGYERDEDLAAAQAAGFSETGPLQVWIR